MNANITVYDFNMRKVAYLENAFEIGYEKPLNGLWTAHFSLPANDKKNVECQPLRYVEIWDDRKRVELFRILNSTAVRSSSGQIITYECEHVLATLLNDVLFQYHQIGNLGVYTKDVLEYVLSKQTTKHWQLGEVEFNHQFEYNWENDSLLAALFSIPKPFVGEYTWTWDTSKYPWTLNLVKPKDGVQAYIRYGVNMQEITRVIDPLNLANRIYGLGYGEGVNQLTFAEINNGVPYIEDKESIAKYGLYTTVFSDLRFQYPETLLARCEVLLKELSQPRVSYTVSASDIHRLTGQTIYDFSPGANVRVQDKEMGEDFVARIVNVSKGDITGAPGEVTIEIANKPQDIAGSIAELNDRQKIHELYAQGATNYDSHDFADNCDPQHPAVLKFWIPEETARINKVMLSYQSEAFRSYSRAIESAPATTSGPSSRETTASGGQTTSGPSSRTTTVSGGAIVDTTEHQLLMSGFSQDRTWVAGEHNHGIENGTQLLKADGGVATFVESGLHDHAMFNHGHRIDIPPHTHGMDHTHTIAPHTHGMDHTHQIPSHTHGIEHGIFRGPTPTGVTVRVDGNVVTGLGANENEIDIIPYLSKSGSGGRINRGWHTIEILPNSLGRIVANVFIQLFAQSRGGGDY